MQPQDATPSQLAYNAARKERLARWDARAFNAALADAEAPKPSNVIQWPYEPRASECWIDVTCWPPVANRRKYLLPEKSYPSIKRIQNEVCAYFNVNFRDLISQRRTADIVLPRQVAGYLAKTLTPHSYPEIGRRFGGRDHSTQICAFRKIERLIQSDEKIAKAVEILRERLL